ncbi:hypothetical protein MHEI_42490 [Mycobacterium heidelbergense]|nr:hypothetical protein MHEI_42490 [Mycobacterium heidelbergense]
MAFIHDTYGTAAAAIAPDDGPTHGPLVNAESVARYEVAAEPNSAANLLQDAAAITSGPDPAPAYIRAELTSGGNPAKSRPPITASPP